MALTKMALTMAPCITVTKIDINLAGKVHI